MSDDDRRPGGESWGPRGGPWARRRARRHWGGARHRGGAGFIGCLLLAIVVLVGLVSALATWVAAAVLGALAPSAAPSGLTAVAVVFVAAFGLVLASRAFGVAVGPLADLAAATRRLADGEPGVRVRPRGPRPVRGLAASFNAMAERLDRSRADRQALLADVTHELRTPLSVIGGGIEAMLDGVHPLDAAHLAPILGEVRVMDRLLDDLRTVSLADAGALPIYREPVDVAELASEVASAMGSAAEGQGVDLRLAGDDPVEATLDPVRVREILANLVTNAMRHTPAGGRVEIAVRSEGRDVVIAVSDTGEGIPPEDIGRVFDRFQHRSDTGGSGLGLTIVRDLAAAHGGRVEVESEGIPGRGSTFRVRLPLDV